MKDILFCIIYGLTKTRIEKRCQIKFISVLKKCREIINFATFSLIEIKDIGVAILFRTIRKIAVFTAVKPYASGSFSGAGLSLENPAK